MRPLKRPSRIVTWLPRGIPGKDQGTVQDPVRTPWYIPYIPNTAQVLHPASI